MGALDELEWRVLQALCSERSGKRERETSGCFLNGYRWREPIHQAIFEAIMSFPAASRETLREQLPARLTRGGFPDFEFASLFESSGFSPGELEKLISKLREVA